MPMIIGTPESDTNIYYHVSFEWSYPAGIRPGDFFYLYEGNQSYTFTNKINVGAVTNYTLERTNWSETFALHFYSVTLCRTNVESDFSGEVRYPIYFPDRITVSWSSTNITTVQSSSDLKHWSVIAMVGGTNAVTLTRVYDHEFIRISRLANTTNIEPARLKVWNPLNEPL